MTEPSGGEYLGHNHAYYGASSCYRCGPSKAGEAVPVAREEVQEIVDGAKLGQIVFCSCGAIYYAVYDIVTPVVGIVPIDHDKVRQEREEMTYDQRN